MKSFFSVSSRLVRVLPSLRQKNSRLFHAVAITRQQQVIDASIDSLGKDNMINDHIVDALKGVGFKTLTPVQQQTIKPVLENPRGIIARAKTGTGKTLAFGIPLLQEQLLTSDERSSVKALIVAPTRDLALQIEAELSKVVTRGSYLKQRISLHSLIGGADRRSQERKLRSRDRPNIVVATPGRLFDFLEDSNTVDAFRGVRYVVLDEADRLLDQGFKEDLIRINNKLKRISSNETEPLYKTLLFSATIDKNVLQFAESIMGKSFQYIDTVDENEPETHEKIDQALGVTNNIFESYAASISYMIAKLEDPATSRNFKPIVFLPTVKSVDYFKNLLDRYLRTKDESIKVFDFHGKLSQAKRERTVNRFSKLRSAILITSDVGARGMDFPNVTDVIQIGVTSDLSNYVHRIGRTARGGKTGNAILFVSKAELGFVDQLSRKGIKFAQEYDYVPIPEVEQEIESICSTEYSLSEGVADLIQANLGFYSSVIRTYRLDKRGLLNSFSKLYNKFGGEGKPTVSKRVWQDLLSLDYAQASTYFQIGYQDPGEQRFYKRDRRSDFAHNSKFGDRASKGRGHGIGSGYGSNFGAGEKRKDKKYNGFRDSNSDRW